MAESCFLIGKGLVGSVSTIDLVGDYNYSAGKYKTESIEYIRICNGILAGSLIVSFEGVLSKRIDEILPHIQEVQNDIFPLYFADSKECKIYRGPSCGWNAVNIVRSLRHKYGKNVSMISMKPRAKNSTWFNHLGYRLNVGKSYNIQQRDKFWGVGTTIGVIYHALPIFQWPEENLYISVESTLICASFQLQFHVTQSLEEMVEFMEFRYLATNVEIRDDLGVAVGDLTHRPANFVNFNVSLATPKTGKVTRRASSAGRVSLMPQSYSNAIAGKNKQVGGKKTRKQNNKRKHKN